MSTTFKLGDRTVETNYEPATDFALGLATAVADGALTQEQAEAVFIAVGKRARYESVDNADGDIDGLFAKRVFEAFKAIMKRAPEAK